MLLFASFAWANLADHEVVLTEESQIWTTTIQTQGDCPTLPKNSQVVVGSLSNAGCSERLTIKTTLPASGSLTPPITADLHRVHLDHGRFIADNSLLITRVAHSSSPTVTSRDRRLVRRTFKRRAGHIYYLKDLQSAGLPGHFRSSKSEYGVAIIGALLSGVVLAGALFYRALNTLARRERVNSWLNDRAVKEELNDLGVS